jgi:hypothetical protein
LRAPGPAARKAQPLAASRRDGEYRSEGTERPCRAGGGATLGGPRRQSTVSPSHRCEAPTPGWSSPSPGGGGPPVQPRQTGVARSRSTSGHEAEELRDGAGVDLGRGGDWRAGRGDGGRPAGCPATLSRRCQEQARRAHRRPRPGSGRPTSHGRQPGEGSRGHRVPGACRTGPEVVLRPGRHAVMRVHDPVVGGQSAVAGDVVPEVVVGHRHDAAGVDVHGRSKA